MNSDQEENPSGPGGEQSKSQPPLTSPPAGEGWVTARTPINGWHNDPWLNPDLQFSPGQPVWATGDAAPLRARRKKRRFLVLVLTNIVIPLALAFAIAMFAQATIAKPYQIPSGSMLPTIQLQDRILANRLIYHFRGIERGDVVVFRPPASMDASIPYVKRVVGLPGDTVEVKNNKVLVNGEEFEVPAASRPTYTKSADTVPEGQLFVLGDNRNESSDSHVWGYVPVENVIGRADVIYWPPKHLQWLGN